MDIEFIEPASIELDDAITYYDMQLQGLGKKFFEEVLQTINLISVFPKVWAKKFSLYEKGSHEKIPLQFNLLEIQKHNLYYCGCTSTQRT